MSVVATVYIASASASLYCGLPVSQTTEPWIALPPSPSWQCGDLHHLSFTDGTSLMARALDSGSFSTYCVQSGSTCSPIVADIPLRYAPFPGLSVGVLQLTNITAMVRELDVQ